MTGSNDNRPELRELDIAVVGMASRFPGATTPDAYWSNIRDGVESIVGIDEAALRAEGVPDALLADPAYVRRGAFLDDMEGFDANFFGFSALDASLLDPQHRHFLEVCWEALEDAGHPPSTFGGPIAVFAGAGMHAYMMYNLISNPSLMESVGLFLVRHTGNDKDFLATRVSYELDLTGPSINVQTACSTSLVAMHMAAQSLLSGECDMALAGGVTIEQPHRRGYLYKQGEILSPDGHCRPFDADSQGTIFGSGAGVLVLRRLVDAVEDGDHVHAVIKATAINNDGRQKVGYLAPSVDGQARAIAEALQLSDVPAETIRFVETHGTGTPVGDPIEVTALTQAYGAETERTQFCALGSVKSNIGHTDTAAGVAGTIKAIQAIKHAQIPPTLHFRAPNPAVDFDSSPFYVAAELKPWPDDGHPRRAGVSSLGVGGTNAHIVLEQAPDRERGDLPARTRQLLPISAKTPGALSAALNRLAAHLEATPELDLADVAYTLAHGRTPMVERRTVVATTAADAVAALRDAGQGAGPAPADGRRVAFLFAGGGAQYPGMGRDLYEAEPAYRDTVDELLGYAADLLDYDLKALLMAGQDDASAVAELRRPTRALPALFVTQLAHARLLASWGIEPDAMIGHSMGEYTAACLAGVFTARDALRVVYERGRLFETVPAGGMSSVMLPANELAARLPAEVSLAAVNSPGLSLAAGPVEALTALEAELAADGIDARRLHIDVAAHSSMLDEILPPFRAFLQTLEYGAPKKRFASNLSGGWADAAEVRTPEYWVRHLRETVRFADGIGVLLEGDAYALLEVGPGRTLASLARLNVPSGERRAIIQGMRHPSERVDDASFALGALGQVWEAGCEVDFAALRGEGERPLRVPLPTYPFEHKRYWIAPGEHAYHGEGSVREAHGGRTDDASQWYYRPAWRSVPLDASHGAVDDAVLVLGGDDELTNIVAVTAVRDGASQVFVATLGETYSRSSDGRFVLRPGNDGDWLAMMRELQRRHRLPARVVHLWSLDATLDVRSDDAWEALRERTFGGLFRMASALGTLGADAPMLWTVVTRGVHGVAGAAPTNPAGALCMGPVGVVPHEFPGIACRQIDLDDAARTPRQLAATARAILSEPAHTAEPVVALRAGERLVREFVAAPLRPDPDEAAVEDGDVVLVTGGLGGLGLVAARALASRARVRLALLSRSGLPPRDAWNDVLARDDRHDPAVERIRAVRDLEALGAEVETYAVDVADVDALRGTVETIRAHFGAIDGVLHCAGVLDDELIVMSDIATCDRVLAPKVRGTLALDRVLADACPRFFVGYASVSGFLGMAGQAAYASANAFLDAFAPWRAARLGEATVSIDWPAWQDVGMAAGLAESLDSGRLPGDGRPVDAPLLDRLVADNRARTVHVARLSTASHWLLDDHRLADGHGLIPGTGYLELAREAFVGIHADQVELADVSFARPFVVRDGEARALRVVTTYGGSEASWSVQSSAGEHASGTIRRADARPAATDLAAVAARCDVDDVSFDGPRPDPFVRFGARWGNLRRARFGRGEALLTLALDDAFAGDLDGARLHPAVLDLATAGVQTLIDGFDAGADFYVPMAYRRLWFSGTMPTEVFSHVRFVSGGAADGVAEFAVTLVDGDGSPVVAVDGFTMRRLDDPTVMAQLAPDDADADWDPAALDAPAGDRAAVQRSLDRGVSPDEGAQALVTVLSTPSPAQVVVSPWSLDALIREVHDALTDEGGVGIEVEEDDDAFEAPRDDVEATIAGIWKDALGVRRVGVRSDFFQLGGHSLMAIRITSRINQAFGTDLPLRALFESPTVEALATIIRGSGASTSAAAAEAGAERVGAATIPTVDRDAPLMPSFAQEGLWFLSQVRPDAVAYNIGAAFLLGGPLDTGALERALTALVARQESLRIVFEADRGRPRLRVLAPWAVKLKAKKVPKKGGSDQARARAFADASAAIPFDLATGPLVRFSLGALSDDAHVLVLTMHHIVSDEWSLELLYDELGRLYVAERDGGTADLAELPVQYADFAAWQRRRLDETKLAELTGWWQRELAGARTAVELPADRPRPPTPTLLGSRTTWAFGDELTADLRELARRHGVTMYVTLLAAVQVLVSRLTGQDDVIVASPTSMRPRTELEPLAGLFVNTVPLRATLSPDMTFAEALGYVRDVAMDAFEHQDLPFDVLVRELPLERDPSRNPLYQVMFAIFPSTRALPMGELEVTPVDVDPGGAQVDLTLYVADADPSLMGIAEYNTDVFDEETIFQFSERLGALLRDVVRDENERIGALTVMNDAERDLLLSGWNDTQADYETSATVSTLFEVSAREWPDAVAVWSGETALTYAELDDRASRIATHLQALGARPGDFVGVCTRRHDGMLAALLGAMKAGCAYLPLDPDFPPNRLAWMLEDTAAPVIVTEDELRDQLPPHRAHVVSLDGDADAIDASAPMPHGTVPHDASALAYVIYTSGSTGRPKGVRVPHRGVVNFLRSMAKAPGFTRDDVLVAVTTISFDISVLELFLPLSVGGQVVIASKRVATDGRALAELVEASGATVMQATPATWRLMLHAGWDGSDALTVLCGGEALPRDLAGELVARTGALWNMYGPTETTIWSTIEQITDADAPITIGRPIDNTTCYVVDPRGQLTPPGVPGELWIGGDGVTDGYHRRPDLTAERFVADPFRDGGTAYRTSDLVRWTRDGRLEYLSRIDTQVKVRGFRIELGEIESVLAKQPGVSRCVVDARSFGAGDTRLVAYVIPDGAFDAASAREGLRAALPDYMVPSLWETLDAFPLTANGKIDRKRLPTPGLAGGSTHLPPETAEERWLAGLWEGALQVAGIGRHDNFFDMGGHSLLAMSIIYEVEQRAGHRFNPLEISMQTLSQLAAAFRLPAEVAAELGSVNASTPAPPVAAPARAHEPAPAAHRVADDTPRETPDRSAGTLAKKALKKISRRMFRS